MHRLASLALLIAVSSPLGAQIIHRIGKPTTDTTPPARPIETPHRAPVAEGNATLSGQVFDSLRNEPVHGATVVVAGTTHQTVTDANGMYKFFVDSLPEGSAVIGFFMANMDSLGIAPPARQIVIRHGESALLDLGTPSMRSVLRVICGDSASEGRGLMMGVVRDADNDKPLVGALVVVMWTEMNIGTTSLSKLPKAVHTTVNEHGSYRVCGIPNGVALRAQARLGSKASGWIDVNMTPGGVLQRDFLVGERVVAQARTQDTTHATTAIAPKPLGSAQLSGTVVGPDGKPLEGANVYLVGTAIGARADSRGVFRLTGLPSGTHTIEVRQISFALKRYTVDLSPTREMKLTAMLDTRATVLGEVTVEAKAGSSIPGFDERAKRGMGNFLTRDDIEKRQSILLTDLFRTVPGINVAFDGTNYSVRSARSGNMSCPMQWYLDGSPFDNSDNSIDQMLRPDDIEGIEVYKSASEVPVQYQGQNASCGTILVWTKRAAGGRLKKAANKSP